MTDRATFDAISVWVDQNLPGKRYFPVYVEILGANQSKIDFLAIDVNDVWSRFTATWGDLDEMWASFPSTLPSGAQGPVPGVRGPVAGAPPAKDAFGILYLSQGFINGHANRIAPPKWPKAL